MTDKNQPYILVWGVSVYDIFGFTHDNYKTHDSNPGNIKVSFGGVCRNIAENMARIGINTKFISILGDDERGRSILKYSEDIDLDMKDSLILKEKNTPTYMAILNEQGEMVSAVVDMNITEEMTEDFVNSKSEIISKSKYMVVDTDNPCILEYIVNNYKEKTNLILDPVSSAKAEKIKHIIKYFHTIKPNRCEAEALCGFKLNNHQDVKRAGEYFINLGIKNVFISLDCEGIYYNNGIEEGIIKAENVCVRNVTGAGDSLVAGIGYGYMNDLSLKDTVKYAIAMSVITISHEETIHPEMEVALVENYIKECNWVEVEF